MISLPACSSHLLVDLPLFGGPVVLVVAAVALISRSERRRAAGGDPAEATRSPQEFVTMGITTRQ